MTVLEDLLEEKRTLWSKAEEIRKKEDWTAEDEQRFDQVIAEFDAVGEKIQANERRQQKLADLEQRTERRERDRFENRGDTRYPWSSDEEANELAIRAWLKAGNDQEPSEYEQRAADHFRIRPNARGLDVRMRSVRYGKPAYHCDKGREDRKIHHRAQSVGTGADGGYLVPEGFSNQLERAMLAYGGLRNVATIFQTDMGNTIPWPTINDTANAGRLVGENTEATETPKTFGVLEFKAPKLTSDLVLVSQELIEDSAFDIGSMCGELLGERIARGFAGYYATGTGAGTPVQPQGLVTASTLGITATSATAITADELIDLFHSVDPSYAQSSNAAWAFNNSTLGAIRKLKGSDNNYLWVPGLRAGEPDLLLGRPYVVVQEMPSIATGTKPIVYGDVSKFRIRDVRSVRLYRLDERYREFDQTGFVAFFRSDSRLVNAGTNPVKHLLMA